MTRARSAPRGPRLRVPLLDHRRALSAEAAADRDVATAGDHHVVAQGRPAGRVGGHFGPAGAIRSCARDHVAVDQCAFGASQRGRDCNIPRSTAGPGAARSPAAAGTSPGTGMTETAAGRRWTLRWTGSVRHRPNLRCQPASTGIAPSGRDSSERTSRLRVSLLSRRGRSLVHELVWERVPVAHWPGWAIRAAAVGASRAGWPAAPHSGHVRCQPGEDQGSSPDVRIFTAWLLDQGVGPGFGCTPVTGDLTSGGVCATNSYVMPA